MIKVIDSLMGCGKTKMAINTICNNPEQTYIYITPYLDEIQRLKKATFKVNRMYEPTYQITKKDSFHKLLIQGKNICSTHALFTKADTTTRNLLKANDYILILDEVMDVVSELKDFTKKDLRILMDLELVRVEDNILIWNEDKEKDEYKDLSFRYNDIKTMCNNKNLVLIHDKLIYWNFPADIFSYFKEVLILTYEFKAQLQRYYYDWYGIDYEIFQIEEDEIVEYTEERKQQRLENIKHLISIYDGKNNNIGNGHYDLSLNWFKKAIDDSTGQIEILKSYIVTWFKNQHKETKFEDKLWTTFKIASNHLKGKGYTKRFLSMNMRATNDYRNTNVLVYACNRFLKPEHKTFFSDRGITIDEDLWSTVELLQWIWRSAIREHKPIDLYLPSKRMRDNLKYYLNI